MMDEKNRAPMEAHQIAAEDEYFAARPQIDCNDRRKVFEAGFKMAWNIAKREQASPKSNYEKGVFNPVFDTHSDSTTIDAMKKQWQREALIDVILTWERNPDEVLLALLRRRVKELK